jgi:hypothetical protein
MRFEYCCIEWNYDDEEIYVTFPDGSNYEYEGKRKEVVRIMTQLGSQGWEAVGSSKINDAVLWTFKRQVTVDSGPPVPYR